jgi:hypothetical protein
VSGVNVRGHLVAGGAPLKLLPDEEIWVGLVGLHGGEEIACSAQYDPETGTVEITGPDNNGIPPGDYRVEIVSQLYGGDGSDRFEAVFDAAVTPLVLEVGPEEGQEFVIDLYRKTVTNR